MTSLFHYTKAENATRFVRDGNPTPGQDNALATQLDRRLLQIQTLVTGVAILYPADTWDWWLVVVLLSYAGHLPVGVRPSIIFVWQWVLFMLVGHGVAFYGGGLAAPCIVMGQASVTALNLLWRRIWYGLDVYYC